MNSVIFVVVLLFCGLTFAEDSPSLPDNLETQSPEIQSPEIQSPEIQSPETQSPETQSHGTQCDILNVWEAVATLRVKVGDLENRLKDSEQAIEHLKSKEQVGVIFSATLPIESKHIGPFNTDITLVFRNVIVNIGSAYSPSTGIFTAPVAGVYYFTMFYHAGGHQTSALVLYKNNQSMFYTSDHLSQQDTADNGGNGMFLPLQRGDQVYVRLPQNKHVWAHKTTTFSGFLVKAE